jgi:hypothetical protein
LAVGTRRSNFRTLAERANRFADAYDRCVEILRRQKPTGCVAAFVGRSRQADAAIDAKLSRGVVAGERL